MTKRSFIAMLLAYLIPGAGHFYLNRRGRAAAYFCIILFMFVIGLMVEGGLYTLTESRGALLRVLASLGSMGSGMLYFVAKNLQAGGNVTSMTFEYGRTFTLTAGLMNLLLVVDCFDIVKGRKQ